MEIKDLEPVQGFFEKLRPFVRGAVEKMYPASAVTLTALRSSKPELAKRIFAEAVMVPARAAIAKYMTTATDKLLEEIESRFRQEDIVTLLYEVEVLVASRIVAEMFERTAEIHEHIYQEPVRGLQGKLTPVGAHMARWLAGDVCDVISNLAAVRERRIQILLAAEVVGAEAVQSAVDQFAGYKRAAVMQSVWEWLGLQNLDNTTRERFADYIAKGSDERIARAQQQLEGSAFLGQKTVEIIIDEIFTGDEYIEF